MSTNTIEIIPYTLPLAIPYRWSKGVHHTRSGLLVRIDVEGAVGWGEAAFEPHVVMDGERWAESARAMTADLDPRREDFLTKLAEREIAGRLRCGLSSAWFAAQAAHRGQSLAAYLAGPERVPAAKVPVNALISAPEPEALVAEAARAVERGQTTVKIKCSADRERDRERVAAVRQAFPDLRIRLDPNEAWSAEWALAHLKDMAEYDIEYVEDPLPRTTPLSVFAELRAQSPIPIALDCLARSRVHAQLLIEVGAADVLILKAPRIGGPDLTLDIVEEAARAGVRCVITASLETSVGIHVALHLCALLPEPLPDCGLGTSHFFARDVAPPPPVVDGGMDVPAVPGLGVEPVLE